MIMEELGLPFTYVGHHDTLFRTSQLWQWECSLTGPSASTELRLLRGRQEGAVHQGQPEWPVAVHPGPEHGADALGVGRHRRVPGRDVRQGEQAHVHDEPRKVPHQAVPTLPVVRPGPVLRPGRLVPPLRTGAGAERHRAL